MTKKTSSQNVETTCYGCGVRFRAQFKLPVNDDGSVDYSPVQKGKKYCSPRCKIENPPYIEETRNCQRCGSEFQTKFYREDPTKAVSNYNLEYCSKVCRNHKALAGTVCEVEGCEERAEVGELCSIHYWRIRRNRDPHVMKRAANGAHREFLEESIATEVDECILWPEVWSHVNGYGLASLQGDGMKLAHVYVAERVHGECPDGHEAAHSCGVRDCLNKRHVRWATHSENELDKRLHGRDLGGERNHQAKLTEDDVRAIRRAYSEGVTQGQISFDFGISQSSVSKIVNGKKWASVS